MTPYVTGSGRSMTSTGDPADRHAGKRRCSWISPATDPLMVRYHDEEWGVPVHDDRKLFEVLVLEGMQAGLSWRTVLNKRENFRKALHDFDPEAIARFTDNDTERLLRDPGIIRNRRKIASTVTNAKKFLQVHEEFGSFDAYIWRFVGGRPIDHRIKPATACPGTSPESDAMSKDLKKRGFSFAGSVICYSFMQAVGMVNDHETCCFRHGEVNRMIS